ncbi:MAG: DUF5615 family PIN-like protein [Thermoanaerobaculia bacterium]
MSVGFYSDHNVNRAITQGLRLRGVDVRTALEDEAAHLSDPELLDRATALERVLLSSDHDLIVEARRRQHERTRFAGVIFVPQRLSIGLAVEELQLLAQAGTPTDFVDSLLFLPLR